MAVGAGPSERRRQIPRVPAWFTCQASKGLFYKSGGGAHKRGPRPNKLRVSRVHVKAACAQTSSI